MKWALIRKEIAEHWVTLTVLFLFAAMLYVLFALSTWNRGNPPFEALRDHVRFSVPFVAWFLGGRLVRQEFGGGTQLFLDALPIRRSSVLTAKYVIGAAALVACTAPAFLVSWMASLRSHDVTAGLLAILLARTFAFVWLAHAVCFALGFLGRYRTALVVVTLCVFAAVVSKSDIEFADFGPFALVGKDFAFERNVMPTSLVLGTCGAAVAFTALAYGLAAMSEGSVAARLAQQMSQREKAFVGLAVLVSVFAIFTVNEKRAKKPFAPPAAAEMASAGLRVVVGAGSTMTDSEANHLATITHARIDAMREWLAIEKLPPVFVFSRHGLDATKYEHGKLEHEEGVVVRVNYGAAGWDDDQFIGQLVQIVIRNHTDWRSSFERRGWIAQGFGAVWMKPDHAAMPLETDSDLLVRALVATPDGVTRRDLDEWDSFRQRVGGSAAGCVAWSGVRVLTLRHGADAAKSLFRDALGTKPPKDARALFGAGSRGVGELLERHAGVSYDAFLAEWNEELDAARERHGDTLAAIPGISAEVRVVGVSDATCEIDYTAKLDCEPDPAARVKFEWKDLGPFSNDVDEDHLESDDVAYAEASKERRVAHSFRRGARIAWRVAYTSGTPARTVVSPLRRTIFE